MSCAIYSLRIYFVVSVFHDFIHFSVNENLKTQYSLNIKMRVPADDASSFAVLKQR